MYMYTFLSDSHKYIDTPSKGLDTHRVLVDRVGDTFNLVSLLRIKFL